MPVDLPGINGSAATLSEIGFPTPARRSDSPPVVRRGSDVVVFDTTRLGAPDTQGRLVLPPDFCDEFQLTGEVILVGNEGRFEVWNVDRWQQTAAADEAIFDHVGNLIGL